MIDAREVDYIVIMDEVEIIKKNLENIKKSFDISLSQDLFDMYNLKSKELLNILDNINHQLSDKNGNRY